jgi:hypothetical protein
MSFHIFIDIMTPAIINRKFDHNIQCIFLIKYLHVHTVNQKEASNEE